jgi:hypothetical protein
VKRENPKYRTQVSLGAAKLWSDCPKRSGNSILNKNFGPPQKYKVRLQYGRKRSLTNCCLPDKREEERALQAVDESRTCPLSIDVEH